MKTMCPPGYHHIYISRDSQCRCKRFNDGKLPSPTCCSLNKNVFNHVKS